MKILFVSLGCDKNLVDSEVMLGLLRSEGFQLTGEEAEADVIVVNSCCFIGDAKEESINTILEMAAWKEEGVCRALIVTGCLAERYKAEVLAEMPEVDAVVGTASYDKIVEVVKDVLHLKSGCQVFQNIDQTPEVQVKRVVTTGGHYAFLKIAEGCDKHCTYCIIPKVRGKYRSVAMERLVRETEELAAGGVRELILVAQETTLYGCDLYGHKALPELLRKLAAIPGIVWIRIQYCYPEEITDELIQVIRQEKKICRYLDIPVQHASDSVLKRMGRRTNGVQLREMIRKLRAEIPELALRTTLISGFPGETKEDHEILMDFVEEMEFDRLGVFAYSQEEDTPAAVMETQVPEDVKEERRSEVMELQQEISLEKSQEMIGRTLLVMIEGKVADENAYVGRTYRDAPNVDGYIFINTDQEMMTGDFARVQVTGALEYDLIGEICDEFTE